MKRKYLVSALALVLSLALYSKLSRTSLSEVSGGWATSERKGTDEVGPKLKDSPPKEIQVEIAGSVSDRNDSLTEDEITQKIAKLKSELEVDNRRVRLRRNELSESEQKQVAQIISEIIRLRVKRIDLNMAKLEMRIGQ